MWRASALIRIVRPPSDHQRTRSVKTYCQHSAALFRRRRPDHDESLRQTRSREEAPSREENPRLTVVSLDTIVNYSLIDSDGNRLY